MSTAKVLFPQIMIYKVKFPANFKLNNEEEICVFCVACLTIKPRQSQRQGKVGDRPTTQRR